MLASRGPTGSYEVQPREAGERMAEGRLFRAARDVYQTLRPRLDVDRVSEWRHGGHFIICFVGDRYFGRKKFLRSGWPQSKELF